MATIQAGGGRRSAAPTYTPFKPVQSEALTADPELLRRSIFDSVTGGVVGDSSAGNSVSEAFGRGVSTMSGQGANASTSSPGSAGPNSATGARALGMGLSALGTLGKDGSLGRIGSIIGLGGALAGARSPGEALGTLAGPALGALGVPGSVLGLGTAAVKGDISMAVNSALSMANPALGALNALGSLLGIGTVGSFAKNTMQNVDLGTTVSPDAGLLGQYAEGRAINESPDPLGSLINAMQDAWGVDVAAPALTDADFANVGTAPGYSSSGPGAYGFFGGGRAGGGSPSGRNGGPGPGNNGGHASGAGGGHQG